MEKNIIKKADIIFKLSCFITVLNIVSFIIWFYGVEVNNNLIAVPFFVITLVSFFMIPILWSKNYKIQKLINVYNAITQNKISSVQIIANNMGKSKKYTFLKITKLINEGYLTGYSFNQDGTELLLIDNMPQNIAKIYKSKCQNCGATYTYITDDICPYCNCQTRH